MTFNETLPCYYETFSYVLTFIIMVYRPNENVLLNSLNKTCFKRSTMYKKFIQTYFI